MKRLGFIHDMMDVKVLILYVAARAKYPMTVQELYEVSFQDDCLSYFDVCTAVPELVKSGHLQEVEQERYEITQKGRDDGALTADSIAFTVKQRAEDAVLRYNAHVRRRSYVKTEVKAGEDGFCSAIVQLNDDMGILMRLELMAPDQRQAIRLSKLMEQKAEELYDLAMTDLLDEEE